MSTWTLLEASKHFSDLVATAVADGPQVVRNGTEAVAVLMSPGDFDRMLNGCDQNIARLMSLDCVPIPDRAMVKDAD